MTLRNYQMLPFLYGLSHFSRAANVNNTFLGCGSVSMAHLLIQRRRSSMEMLLLLLLYSLVVSMSKLNFLGNKVK